MFIQNFSSLAYTQTDLDTFLKEISRLFRKTLRIQKKTNLEYAILYLTQQSIGMQNFSSLACTQTDLDKFLTIFEENSRIFQENFKANSKKFQI
jgi:hypothetical protein